MSEETELATGSPDVVSAPPPDSSFRYSVERGAGSMATVKVEVDGDRLTAMTDRVFQRRVRQAKIPGFRPGKAPRAMYERAYGGEHLWHEAAEELIEETYREILRRDDLSPVDRPEIELGPLEPNKAFEYTAVVPVRPEVSVGEYANHGVTIDLSAVTDEDVGRTIDGLRDRSAEVRAVDRPAQERDVLTVDLDANVEGRQLPPLGRNAHLELGREYGIPGLSEGLIGISAGEERSLELSFPEDNPDEALRGKPGRFTVKVSQVSEKLVPEADDDFAKTIGAADIVSLRSAIRNDLAHRAFHEARDSAAERLMDHLLEITSVEVPDVLVEDEVDHLLLDLKERLTQQGLTYEQFLLQARKTEEELRADWRPAAERRAKSLLILDALANREGVTVSGEELAQELANTPLAGRDPAALRDPGVLSSMARSLRNRKLVDRLIGLGDPASEQRLIEQAGGAPAVQA